MLTLSWEDTGNACTYPAGYFIGHVLDAILALTLHYPPGVERSLSKETLHSIFALLCDEELIPYSLREWQSVIEGLMEFLTGYVLYKQRKERERY